MEIDIAKAIISKTTGIPLDLLEGKTAEEVNARAEALLSFRNGLSPEKQKSVRKQFSEFFNDQLRDRSSDIFETRESDNQITGQELFTPYPQIRDSGETDMERTQDPRPAREIFAQYFGERTAFDPFR